MLGSGELPLGSALLSLFRVSFVSPRSQLRRRLGALHLALCAEFLVARGYRHGGHADDPESARGEGHADGLGASQVGLVRTAVCAIQCESRLVSDYSCFMKPFGLWICTAREAIRSSKGRSWRGRILAQRPTTCSIEANYIFRVVLSSESPIQSVRLRYGDAEHCFDVRGKRHPPLLPGIGSSETLLSSHFFRGSNEA